MFLLFFGQESPPPGWERARVGVDTTNLIPPSPSSSPLPSSRKAGLRAGRHHGRGTFFGYSKIKRRARGTSPAGTVRLFVAVALDFFENLFEDLMFSGQGWPGVPSRSMREHAGERGQ
jgi:hypothetical protein